MAILEPVAIHADCGGDRLSVYGCVLTHYASYAVGGSDSSGYASIASALLGGGVVKPVAELRQLALPDEFIRVFIPLGYAPAQQSGTMSPTYPIGLPLHMAAGVLLAGWEYGPYVVSPVAALATPDEQPELRQARGSAWASSGGSAAVGDTRDVPRQ